MDGFRMIMWILGGKNARFPNETQKLVIQKIRKCAKILKTFKNYAKYAENYSQ